MSRIRDIATPIESVINTLIDAIGLEPPMTTAKKVVKKATSTAAAAAKTATKAAKTAVATAKSATTSAKTAAVKTAAATAKTATAPVRKKKAGAAETRIMTLRPGPVATNRIHVKNARDTKFGGCAVIIGTGRHARARMHATTGISECLANTTDAIDPVKLAKELGADMCAVNKGRIWTIDEAELLGGYRVDFHGVKMGWVGEMIVKDLMDQFHNAYLPCLIQRFTNWIYHVGKPVHILRDPEGTTWVMQEYTKNVDPTLTIDNLHTVGKKLKNLPKGWKFETKVLTEELSLDTMRSDGWASIMRDELGCTYQACGYGGDTSANYIP